MFLFDIKFIKDMKRFSTYCHLFSITKFNNNVQYLDYYLINFCFRSLLSLVENY